MRLCKPSFEIWDQEEGLEGVYKQIEKAGRVCYKSEDKITETSAKEFVERMIKSGHGAMLEHGTVYLKLNNSMSANVFLISQKYDRNKYSVVNYRAYENDVNNRGVTYQEYFITTNLRVLVENDWMDDLKFACDLTEWHERRVTVKFICDRGVSHEFVRHRVFSFAQESTRYCNYSKDKFGNEITFIHPCWIEDNQDTYDRWCFYESLSKAEEVYFRLLKHGWTPQQARAVLPNALKTELVMTGFISDWEHFFKLRDAGSAHPQARELAQPLHKEFIEKKLYCLT